MALEHGIFAVKLCELEQEYGRLQSRIQLFQGKHPDQIRQERQRLEDEFRERTLLLDETVRTCRSASMARLAQLQRDYCRQIEVLLQSGSLNEPPAGSAARYQDDAEAMTLYAEFAIDFATQSMRHALLAALRAMELQLQADSCTTEGAYQHE